MLEKEVLFTIVGDPQGDLHHLGAQADDASKLRDPRSVQIAESHPCFWRKEICIYR